MPPAVGSNGMSSSTANSTTSRPSRSASAAAGANARCDSGDRSVVTTRQAMAGWSHAMVVRRKAAKVRSRGSADLQGFRERATSRGARGNVGRAMSPHRLAPIVVAALLAAALAAQDPVVPRVLPYPIDLPEDFVAAIDRGTRTTTGRPGPAHWTNRARYDLAIELDPATARLSGHAKLKYINRSPDELPVLWLHLYQNLMVAGQQRTRTVEATPGFELGEVRIGGKVVRARPVDTRLQLRLATPLAAGGELELEIDYAFTVPKAGTAPRMGHEADNVYYLGYWYPQFAVYDDVERWVAA